MAINLELPRKLEAVIEKAHQGAAEMLRPISRKYDVAEHAYPVELDTLATLFEGISEANTISFAGTEAFRDSDDGPKGNINGGNMSALLNALEISWGDIALLLSVPRQGLGNAAISGVATDEQLERLGKNVWAAMAITEPSFGSDSAAVSTTAVLDGDEYVINGEKIFVTAGSRATHIVVWATLDKSLGRAAIKSFIVPREHPGVTVERLEHKLGIKASDTAVIRFDNARIPKENLLGDPEIHVEKGFAGVMETFDNTRPIVAAMAVGVAGRQRDPELQGSLHGQGQGSPGGQRHHPQVGRISRNGRLFRADAAGEVGSGLENPGYLRRHPADPAARGGPSPARTVLDRTQVVTRQPSARAECPRRVRCRRRRGSPPGGPVMRCRE
jgi:alkylation response protein AidB-like acyl-CoA dehydrogenase